MWETAFNLEWLRCSWAFEKRRGIILLNFMVFLLLLLLWVSSRDIETEVGRPGTGERPPALGSAFTATCSSKLLGLPGSTDTDGLAWNHPKVSVPVDATTVCPWLPLPHCHAVKSWEALG